MDAGCLEPCIASSGIQCYFYVIKATLYLKCNKIVTPLLYRLTHIFTCIVPVWQPYSIAHKFKSTEQIQSIRWLKMALSVCNTKYLLYLQSIMTPVGRGRVVHLPLHSSLLLISISPVSAASSNGFHFLFHLIWHFISWRWLWDGVLSASEMHSISAKNLSLLGKGAEDTVKERKG